MCRILAAGTLVVSVLSLTGCEVNPHPPGSYSATVHGKTVHYDDYATDRVMSEDILQEKVSVAQIVFPKHCSTLQEEA